MPARNSRKRERDRFEEKEMVEDVSKGRREMGRGERRQTRKELRKKGRKKTEKRAEN